MKSERMLTTKELIENFNKYYRYYNIWKQRAQKAEKKLKEVKRFCHKIGCSSQRSADEWFLAEEIEILIQRR